MLTKRQEEKLRVELTSAHHLFKKGLNTHAFFKVHNRTTSEDLVQDTFIKTWAYMVKGGKIETMKAFLYHVLNNLIIDEYRKRKNVSLDYLLEKGFEPSINDFEKVLDVLDGRLAFLLIESLPDKYRRVMKMKYVQELTIKEMSLITGQSKNSITVQIHRGLARLKKLYYHQ